MSQRTVKSGAQKRREKKLATLQKAAAQSYSLTNYFSCTSEHGQPEGPGNVDDKIDYNILIYVMKLIHFSNPSQRKNHKKLKS